MAPKGLRFSTTHVIGVRLSRRAPFFVPGANWDCSYLLTTTSKLIKRALAALRWSGAREGGVFTDIYPRPPTPRLSSPHLVPEGQPSGGMPLAGRGRRLRVGLRPTPGRLRGTALGVLRPLCEELAGRHGGTASAGPKTRQGRQRTEKRLSPFRDHPLHETKEIAQASLPNWCRGSQVSEPPCRISAARRLKNAGKRSATGRADGGSIHPRRILAQWKRPDTPAPRGAPLPLIDQRTRQRGRHLACVPSPLGGEGVCEADG